MDGIEYKYEPDYSVPPGSVLEEMLEARGINQAELARRCGRSPKLISEIIGGKAPIEPQTAIQLERVLGMDAIVWTNMEATYRLRQAEAAERKTLAAHAEWAERFPIKGLVSMGVLPKPADKVDAVGKLLDFFGVASVEVWDERFGKLAASFRHSPELQSGREAVLSWLRIGELCAEQISCAPYNRAKFTEALKDIRALTRKRVRDFSPRLRELCADAGVAVVFISSLPRTKLSGAARWLTGQKALIQMSPRCKTNDRFWFTFFHEAGHILLHRKNLVFIDEQRKNGSDLDREADEFAANFLVPRD